MASARDVIPIVLSGLAGLLGGRQAAGAITNAAEISRQGRIDKEVKDRRNQLMANSARQLELSEKAGERAEEQTRMSMDRQAIALTKEKKAAKDKAESDARFKISRDNWIEANPEAMNHPRWGIAFELVKDNQDHFLSFTKEYAKDTGTLSMEEIRAKGDDLRPGESISFPTSSGGRITRSGLAPQRPETAGFTARDLQIYDRQADRGHQRNVVDKAEEKWVDAVEQMNEFEADGGETTSAQYLRLQRAAQAARSELTDSQSPRALWESREEYYKKQGIRDKYIDVLEQDFFAEGEVAAAGVDTSAADALFDEDYGGLNTAPVPPVLAGELVDPLAEMTRSERRAIRGRERRTARDLQP